MYQVYVGIDISAQNAYVHWHDSHTTQDGSFKIAQTPAGYHRLVSKLQQVCQDTCQIHIVMEATGNYWLAPALHVHEHHFAVSVINPVQGKRFAQMQLRRAKTDPIDAAMLCDFARMAQPTLWTPPPAIYYKLQQRLALRDDLMLTRTQFRNRIHAMSKHPHCETSLLAILTEQVDQLTQQIDQLTRHIDRLLASDHQWKQALDHLLTIPGIGNITAAWLLTATHCFERCETPDQAASYAGLVPHPHQSGKSKKKGKTGGGNKTLRSMLYLAAGSALQHNPILKPYYQKLLKRGKIKQIARVAVARKLMHMAWALVVKDRDFDPDFANKSHLAA
jgi:transposase